MNKFKLMALSGSILLSAAALQAGTVLKDAPAYIQAKVDEIEDQGYKLTEWKKSFLGRYQIEFVDVLTGVEREIVVSSSDGSVLRDKLDHDDERDDNDHDDHDDDRDDD